MFLLCLFAEEKVAWILFIVKISDFYGMAVNFFIGNPYFLIYKTPFSI